jgi:hypothetical protein
LAINWIEKDNLLEININTNQKKCYKIKDFKNIEIKCNNEILNFEKRALAFTTISQKLLFDGKVNQFDTYKQ